MTTALDVARAVHLLREEHSWRKIDLARRLGVTNSDISKMERGDFSMNVTTLAKIAKPFGMEAWELLRFADRLRETVQTRHDDEPQLHSKNWRAA